MPRELKIFGDTSFPMIGKKGTKIYSIINLKCPRCHHGNLFVFDNSYNLKHMLDMPPQCPICQQDFKMEPGFYSGALWTSYPIVVLLMIIIGVSIDKLFNLSILLNFIIISLVILMLQPIIMRIGRAIWINLFVKYRG